MAISLKNISTYELIACAKIKKDFNLVYKEIYEWLMVNKVDNYLRLQCLLYGDKNGLSELARNQIQTYFNRVLNKVNKANEAGKEPEIFTFDCYDKLDIDRISLDYTDEHTKGGVLLFGSPVNQHGYVTLTRLNELSIVDVKALLGHLSTVDFRNCLTIIKEFRRTNCPQIAKLVGFYEQQVIRQYFETDERKINLFELNRKAKKQIVSKQIARIIEYIITETGDECIWGSIGPNPKRILSLSTKSNSRGEFNKEILEILIDRIANYTTLGELENDIFLEQEVVTVVGGKIERVKKKPIDRFIVR